MRRSVQAPKVERWYPKLNGFGQWTVVDRRGGEPLASPDPTRRCHAAFLAAAAPDLEAAARMARQRLDALARSHGSLDCRDRFRIHLLDAALIEARPPWEVVARLEASGSQREFHLVERTKPDDQAGLESRDAA